MTGRSISCAHEACGAWHARCNNTLAQLQSSIGGCCCKPASSRKPCEPSCPLSLHRVLEPSLTASVLVRTHHSTPASSWTILRQFKRAWHACIGRAMNLKPAMRRSRGRAGAGVDVYVSMACTWGLVFRVWRKARHGTAHAHGALVALGE